MPEDHPTPLDPSTHPNEPSGASETSGASTAGASEAAAPAPEDATDQSPAEVEAGSDADSTAAPLDRLPGRPQARSQSTPAAKPGLVKSKSGALSLPRPLRQATAVVKVAGSRLLRETGEGLLDFSDWLEGRTTEADLAQAEQVSAGLWKQLGGFWQQWGQLLDRLKAPLPRKLRRTSNASLTGILVGILVFFCLALSSTVSRATPPPSSNADSPLIRRPKQPSTSKLVKSRNAPLAKAEKPSDAASPAQSSREGNGNSEPPGNSQNTKSQTQKTTSAAAFFGADEPAVQRAPQIPPKQPQSPQPSAAAPRPAGSLGNSPGSPLRDSTANGPANPPPSSSPPGAPPPGATPPGTNPSPYPAGPYPGNPYPAGYGGAYPGYPPPPPPYFYPPPPPAPYPAAGPGDSPPGTAPGSAAGAATGYAPPGYGQAYGGGYGYPYPAPYPGAYPGYFPYGGYSPAPGNRPLAEQGSAGSPPSPLAPPPQSGATTAKKALAR